ncbi:MAG TPA: hypothetical protein VFI31_16600 [Pirellulales bacterium]|nr:hypothetical protein [Pirellulales bacterium]
MRYLLVLVVACSPLAALTGWSVWQAATSAAPATANGGQLDTAEIAKRASAAADDAKKEEPLVRSLSATDLLDPNAPNLGAAGAKLDEAWSGSQQARRLLARYARVGAVTVPADGSPGQRRHEAEAALARLKGFVEAEKPNFQGRLPGADDFFATLERHERDLEKEIDRYREKDLLADALTAAKNDLQQGRYDACLTRLAGDPLAKVADPDVAEQLKLLRQRAEYRRAWEELDKSGTAAADEELFGKIQAFLRRYPDAPTAAEADLQTQLERRRDRLKSEISVHVLDQATDLDTLLVEAAQIVANPQIEAPIKQQARHQVTAWLETHLPKIEPPASLLGKQEAVTKSGQRKIGVFFLPPGVDNYRFWTDRKNRDKLRQGEEQISAGALEQPPSTPQYVTWAQKYNQEVAGLVRAGAAQADWQQFADDCDTWQGALAAYREQWGIEDEPDRSCREWSFRDAGLIAKNVLRHWEKYQAIVAPAQ